VSTVSATGRGRRVSVDYQAIRFWVDMGILAWGLAVTGWLYWDRRNQVTQEAVSKLREEHARALDALRADIDLRRRRIDEEMRTIGTRLAEAPTRVDLSRLYEAIGDVSELANQLRGSVGALQKTLQMINQHLLDKH